MEEVDILVIGGGPAGSVAASILHQKGYKVKVVEKLKFPRFVIGESLLPRCMESLEEAGFLDAIKKYGFQEKFGAKFIRGESTCEYDFSESFTPGWTWTWQVPRADFDNLLCEELERKGLPVNFETGVTNIEFFDDHTITTLENKDGQITQVKAAFIVDGSGYGRVIPRLLNLERESTQPKRKTIFAHMKDPNRTSYHEPNRITVIVHRPDTWIWIIPFSTGITSVGYVGSVEYLNSIPGENLSAQLRFLVEGQPEIAERFKDAEFVFEARSIESWSVTTDTFYGNRFVLTGNVTEFLDPVFSSGVTLATVSAQKAAHLVDRTLQGEPVDWDTEYTQFMMQGINTFRSYVTGWYEGHVQDIFFARDPNPVIQRQICSVLAGYVWDLNNPFVKQHDRNLRTLARVLEMAEEERMGDSE